MLRESFTMLRLYKYSPIEFYTSVIKPFSVKSLIHGEFTLVFGSKRYLVVFFFNGQLTH